MAEIIVQGHKIDTKDIWAIEDIEKDKKMFLNRHAGFVIRLVDKPALSFYQGIPYESYPSEIAEIKAKWRKLENEVRKKWEADKSDLPTFTI